MVMTIRGIYHNLNESEYAISNGEVAFFFSSRFYLGKFLKEYEEHRKLFRERIARAMEVDEINTSFLADIHLYKEIEKRGFRVIFLPSHAKIVENDKIVRREGNISWQNLLEYALAQMTEKNTLVWSEMPEQK